MKKPLHKIFPVNTVSGAVRLVAVLNLPYFGIEFLSAVKIGSVSLFADSIDFLEDATVNGLIFIALSWRASHRSTLGMVLAGILLAPGMATLWMAWQKLMFPVPPAPLPLSLIGTGRSKPSNTARKTSPKQRRWPPPDKTGGLNGSMQHLLRVRL